MAELLSTDQITVLGGPSRISVDLDFGPTGQRGSYWYTGNGDPASAEIGASVKNFDMYINVDPQDEDYLWMYQYRTGDTVPGWQRVLKIIPNLYSRSVLSEFVDGLSEILIPLVNILSPDQVGTVGVENFNIQKSVVNPLPSISTITAVEIVTDNSLQLLKISISLFELQGSDWLPIDGQKIVDLIISVV